MRGAKPSLRTDGELAAARLAFNLRSDPFETADHEGIDYGRWRAEHVFLLMPAQQYVGQFLGTFKEFPPRQKAGSFSIDQVLEKLQQGAGN